MARVKQITERSDVPADYQYLYDRIAQARGRVAGPYSILLHSPAVADKVDSLSGCLRTESKLTPREFVLVALAVARARDCEFVWSVQAPNARRAGVAEAEIAAIGRGGTSGLQPPEADLVSYVQQVTTQSRVEQAVFDRLAEGHGVPWLVDLTVAAGHFGLICGINNAFEVPPAAGGDQLPQ